MTARDRRGTARKPREERASPSLLVSLFPCVHALPPHAQGYIIDHNLRRVLHRYVIETSFTSGLSPGGGMREMSVSRRTRSADFTEGEVKFDKARSNVKHHL